MQAVFVKLVRYFLHRHNTKVGLARTIYDISVYGIIPYIYRIYTV
jgi:hypothetical protein